jgi:hypothetical protein
MTLQLTIDGQDNVISGARLDGSAEKWILRAPSHDEPAEEREVCGVWNPFSFPTSDCDPIQFRIAIFTHRNWPESQVLSLREDSRSVGLIFSIQALTSRSIALIEEKMWNDYGFLALSKLCTGDTLCHVGSRQVSYGETYDISDFYDDDSVIAIFQRSACGSQTGSEEDLREYLLNRLPSFVRYGLFLQLEEGASRVRQTGSFEEISEEQRYIRLRSFSSEFPNSTRLFMIDLLTRTDPYEEHPAFRFFLYYQVFESLLQEMYEEYYAAFSRLATDPKFRRASAMKDLIDGLQKTLSEKYRLGVLVGANRRSGDEFDSLRDGCEEILKALVDEPIGGSTAAAASIAATLPTIRAEAPGAPTLPEVAPLPARAGPVLPVAAQAEAEPIRAEQASLTDEPAVPVVSRSEHPIESKPEDAGAAASEPIAVADSAPLRHAAEPELLDSRPLATAEASVLAKPSAEGLDSETSHAKVLYLARNLLFHSFSKVTRKGEELEELADRMALTIYDLAIEYKRPPISLPGF